MQVTFDFPTDQDLTPIEGVCVLSCFTPEGEHVLVHGVYGEPSTLTAAGMYTVALDQAKAEFAEGVEYE